MNPAALAKTVDRFEKLVIDGEMLKKHRKEDAPWPRWSQSSGLLPTNRPPEPPPTVTITPDEIECRAWSISVGAALADVFPALHSSRVAWDQIVSACGENFINPYLDRMRGVLLGATALVREGYVGSFADAIRAETIGELLDQAAYLLSEHHVAAAAGIAGGALETHLRHLVERHGLAVDGHGSIEKYNNAIGKARKDGANIYSLNDSKLITAWGGVRNDADHRPLEFSQTSDQVSMMIEGIRGFLARVS